MGRTKGANFGAVSAAPQISATSSPGTQHQRHSPRRRPEHPCREPPVLARSGVQCHGAPRTVALGRCVAGSASAGSASAGLPKCGCGVDAISKLVSKDGPNKGRKFWVPSSDTAAGVGFRVQCCLGVAAGLREDERRPFAMQILRVCRRHAGRGWQHGEGRQHDEGRRVRRSLAELLVRRPGSAAEGQ